jgi:acetyltransferase-like isoleucine patch superfamily enzyme
VEKDNYKVYSNINLGQNSSIGDYCILGEPPRGAKDGELPLVIGGNCVIRSHTIIYAGNRIGESFQTGHQVFLRENNEIGDDVSIGTKSVIEHHVKIGNKVRIHTQAFIPEYTVLEDGCWIGPNVVITNAPFPCAERTKEFLAGVRVCRGAKIGANSTLLPGVVIGENALVGAGSVVTKDVSANMVFAGNPARALKSVSELRYPDGEQVYL